MPVVLLAEDEPDIVKLVTYILRREGFSVLTATTGGEAIAVARRSEVDVILLDVMLPELDGYGICAALREDPKRAETHYYLGLAQQKRRRLPEARAALEKAVELNPKHAYALAALVKVYLMQGERQLALDTLAKAQAKHPGPIK